MTEPRVVFHGTSSRHLQDIRKKGLRDPYVTDIYARAKYYAGCEVDERGGEPVVLTFLASPDQLRYDAPAMYEPVMADEENRDAAWDEAALAHPDWLDDEGDIRIPLSAWEVSWAGVGSARVEGVVRDWRVVNFKGNDEGAFFF